MMPPHEGWNHPQWRKGEWSMLDKKLREEFEGDMWDILKMFPEKFWTCDAQIIASFASGNAHDWSDIDVLFVPKNPSDTDTYRAEWYGGAKIRYHINIVEALYVLENKYGIKIEISFGLDARSGICYSFRDKKWYGKKEGEAVDKKAKYNHTTKRYELLNRTGANLSERFKTEIPDPWQL